MGGLGDVRWILKVLHEIIIYNNILILKKYKRQSPLAVVEAIRKREFCDRTAQPDSPRPACNAVTQSPNFLSSVGLGIGRLRV